MFSHAQCMAVKMPDTCCVKGCKNRRKTGVPLRFYRIPFGENEKSKERRRLWVNAINIDNWSEEKLDNARICSGHFISGTKSTDPNHPDYVPSVFNNNHCLKKFSLTSDSSALPSKKPEIIQPEITAVSASISPANPGVIMSNYARHSPDTGGPLKKIELSYNPALQSHHHYATPAQVARPAPQQSSRSSLHSSQLSYQSKYGELLNVIEDLGREIKPTYAGSKMAQERLKKGIMHARSLVRECLTEVDKSARQ